MGMEVVLQKERNSSRRPQNLHKHFADTRIFLMNVRRGKAHKHKQFCPVAAWVRGASPDRVAGVFMCCVRKPRNINIFVRVSGGGYVTGVTGKLFMCQMFMCLLWPLEWSE